MEIIKLRKNHRQLCPSDNETNSLTEEQVDEISLRRKNELTRKTKDEIGKSENNILKALNSRSKNSLSDDHNGPSAEIASDGQKTIAVAPWTRLGPGEQ